MFFRLLCGHLYPLSEPEGRSNDKATVQQAALRTRMYERYAPLTIATMRLGRS